MQKPWDQLKENEQRAWINTIEARAEQLVNDVVEVVNHGDFPVVNATIDSFTVKNGEVKVVTKGFADNEMLGILNSAGQKRVQITVMRNDQFDEERTPLKPTPDQSALPGAGFEDEETPDPLPPQEPAVEEPPVENPADEQTDGEEVLKPKSDQWRGGFNSRMARHKRDENPFDPNSGPDWEQWKADWLAGWHAADFDAQAPSLEEPATGDVIAQDGETIDNQGEVTEPAVEKKPRAPRKPKEAPAPIVEPDIAPEGEAAITDHEGGPIENAEQSHAYGAHCRRDGKGTGANPFAPGSELGKAWLRGYNDQKKKDDAAEF